MTILWQSVAEDVTTGSVAKNIWSGIVREMWAESRTYGGALG